MFVLALCLRRHPLELAFDPTSYNHRPTYDSALLHLVVRFVLIYFLKGSLPWQGLKARNAKRKYKIIMERKQAISIQQLCQVSFVRVPLGGRNALLTEVTTQAIPTMSTFSRKYQRTSKPAPNQVSHRKNVDL